MSRDLSRLDGRAAARRPLPEYLLRAATPEATIAVLARSTAWLTTYPDESEIAAHRAVWESWPRRSSDPVDLIRRPLSLRPRGLTRPARARQRGPVYGSSVDDA